jgi:uncharacterized membrane protein
MKSSLRFFLLLIILVSLWCLGIFAAPVLKHIGWTQSADMLYAMFSRVCHQDDSRSFFIEGEKLGVCIRCSSIYFGFWLGMLLLLFFKKLVQKKIPAMKLFLLALFPLAVDVALSVTGIHTSTLETRIITGSVFGLSMPWIVVPLITEAWDQFYSRNKKYFSDSGVLPYVRKTK